MIKLYLILVFVILIAAIVISRQLPAWGAVVLILGTLVAVFFASVQILKFMLRRTIRRSLEMASAALHGATITIHRVTNAPPPPSHQHLIDEEEDGEDFDSEEPDLTPHRYITVDMTVEPVETQMAPASTLAPDEAQQCERDADVPAPPDDDDDDVTKTWNPGTFTLVPIDSTIDPQNLRLADFAAMQAAVAHVEHLDADGSVIFSTPVEDAYASELDETEYASDDENADGTEPPHPVRGPLRLRLTFGIPKDMPGRAKLRYLLEEFTQINIPPG